MVLDSDEGTYIWMGEFFSKPAVPGFILNGYNSVAVF